MRYLQSAYAMFNGDILLAARRPSGEMHLLLGDFTGHGLPAAIGAMPLAEVFYAMTGKGYALRDILLELNSKLATILPVGIFCCAVLIEVNPTKGLVEVWNGGLPDVMILGRQGELLDRVVSTNLPLGVASRERFSPDPVVLVMRPGERLLCWTDGVIETRNSAGQLFGDAGVLRVIDAHKGEPEQGSTVCWAPWSTFMAVRRTMSACCRWSCPSVISCQRRSLNRWRPQLMPSRTGS
ncbi:PP2C family protein-serine/threonine phosphatase [Halopseudomonas pachastrellae]|nr:PP2C family protein-serine/threonine phosphatase [Halopseudomonas pachastrellae]